MSESKDFTQISFNEIKEDLKNFLKSQERFKDFNFEGANMSVMLDILAYNTQKQNFYNNMSISERFLDTAQTKNAVMSHAKELNYLPQSKRSAQATVEVRINAPDNPDFITIPKGTTFTSRDGSTVYEFVTDKAYTVTPSNGAYNTIIPILEGTVYTEFFEVKAQSQRYRMSNPDIDTSSMVVHVAGSRDDIVNGISDEFVLFDSLHGASPTSKAYYLQASEDDTYQIEFGRGVFGIEPEIGNYVKISYRVTNGKCANGAKTFSLKSPISGYSATVYTLAHAEGGADRESIESIRFFSPKALQVQDRAVTERDYEIILKRRFPEIQAVSAYGGEEATPPQYGRVMIAVDVKNAEGVSEALKDTYSTYLRDKTPLGIEPVILSPSFMFVQIDSSVQYNNKETSMSSAEIKKMVLETIKKHSDTALNNFNSTLRFSNLTSAIDKTHPSIMSNDTNVRAIIEAVPYEGRLLNTTMNFGNRIIREPVVMTNNYDINRNPGLISSTFTHRDRTCFIRDNGEGRLQIVTVTSGRISIINGNIGTIDYMKGVVSVKSFDVTSYVGQGITFYATTYSKDFKSPKDRILAIRDSDININVEWVN